MAVNDVIENKYLIKPGYLVIYKEDLHVYGVLASGVFVALCDVKKKYSGCCFYLYPDSYKSMNTPKYGDIAVSHLISKMKKAGSSLTDIKAHIIGGSISSKNDYGQRNTDKAKELLKKNNIDVHSEDTGGQLARKFIYHTKTGESMVMKVHKVRKKDWYPYC